MLQPQDLSTEHRRIRALHGLDILDTAPDERFDRLTRLAQKLFDVPIAAVSLVDIDRQWFKSSVGLKASETPRDWAFCSRAILDDGVTVVPDAMADERFRQTPLVAGELGIRFYAGCPVRAVDGSALGTLCIIDTAPRELPKSDQEALVDLAAMVEGELRALELATTDELTGLANLRGFNRIAAHVLAISQRAERTATLLHFDLNDFKQINDERGHAAGDEALRDFATQLVASFRHSDIVARLGGDEFCVLLSGASEDVIGIPLTLLEERLRDESGNLRVSYSVGVATFEPDRHNLVADLVRDADERMYQDKRIRKGSINAESRP